MVEPFKILELARRMDLIRLCDFMECVPLNRRGQTPVFSNVWSTPRTRKNGRHHQENPRAELWFLLSYETTEYCAVVARSSRFICMGSTTPFGKLAIMSRKKRSRTHRSRHRQRIRRSAGPRNMTYKRTSGGLPFMPPTAP